MLEKSRVLFGTIEKLDKSLRSDKQFIKRIVEYFDFNIQILPLIGESLRSDVDFILELVKINPDASIIASPELLEDKSFVRSLIEENIFACRFKTQYFEELREEVRQKILNERMDRFQYDKKFILNSIIIDDVFINYVSTSWLKDKSFMMDVFDHILKLGRNISLNFLPADCFCDELSDDPEYILKAMDVDETMFHKASNRLKKDKEFLLKAIKIRQKLIGEWIGCSCKDLINDRSFMLECLPLYGKLLRDLDSLQDDEQIVMAALKNNGKYIKYASSRLLDSAEFVLSCKKSHQLDLNYIAQDIVDRDFLLKSFDPNSYLDHKHICYCRWRFEEEFMFELIKKGFRYVYLTTEMALLKEFVKCVVSQNGENLKDLLLEEQKDDHDIQKLAVLSNGFCLACKHELFQYRMEEIYYGCHV